MGFFLDGLALALAALGFGCSQTEAVSEPLPVSKTYKLSAAEIRPLALGRGGAIASDRITVDGRPVGYMYRTRPRDEMDSGWAFLAGDETEAYMAESENHDIYDVNTIANYDRDIIPLLDAPVGAAFIRTPRGLEQDPEGALPE
jgi:hypothetical protein